MEQENRKEELKRKLEGLLNDYTEKAIPLSRTEKTLLENGSEEDLKLVEKYNRSKFRRQWLTSVYSYFDIGEMWGIELEFFRNKKEELQKFLPFFDATHKELEKDASGVQELRKKNEFDVTPEIVERTNQILRDAISKLS